MFGGISVLKAASKLEEVSTIVAMNPWWFAVYKHELRVLKHQHVLTITSESFPKEIRECDEETLSPPRDYNH